MIDSERQWFKFIQGLSLCQTSRDISFCAHAILDDERLSYVGERHQGRALPRQSSCRWRSEDPVYVGVPEVKGLKLGTFCVFDKKPRSFSAEDRQLLKDLARLAEQELMVSDSASPAAI